MVRPAPAARPIRIGSFARRGLRARDRPERIRRRMPFLGRPQALWLLAPALCLLVALLLAPLIYLLRFSAPDRSDPRPGLDPAEILELLGREVADLPGRA